MSFGLYAVFTLFLFLVFGFWLRRLIILRLRPERILADLNEEVRTLIADLNQTGDHNISLLEDRISRLSDLIRRADRQIDDARVMVEELDARANVPTEPDALQEPEESEESEEPDALENTDQDTRTAVLALYEQGLSQDLIAARTGTAIGEVELIISLRGKRAWR